MPGCTGFGAAELEIVRSAEFAAATMTTAVAELFVRLGSFVPDATEIVSAICVPLGAAGFTATITVRVAAPADPEGTSGFVQLMVPLVPTAGVVQLHPVASAPERLIDWYVVFAGIGSLMVALTASCGPLFVTFCVNVMLAPAVTGFGVAEFVTARSAPAQYAPDWVPGVSVIVSPGATIPGCPEAAP